MTRKTDETRAAYVLRRLYTDIQDGEFSAGSRIPAEKDLADLYGVGRSSVREAVRSLAFLGLLDVQQGRRAVVARGVLPDSAPDPLSTLLRGEQLAELLDARKTIETRIAELAAAHARPEDVERLDALVDRTSRITEQSGLDRDEYVHATVEFHLAVARASGNSFFVRLLTSLIGAHWDTGTSEPESRALMQDNTDDHRRIVAAIAAGDPRAAAESMADHLERFQRRVDKVR